MLPVEFIERIQQICPTTLLDTTIASFEQEKTISFRINRLKHNAEQALQLAEKLRQEGLNLQTLSWLNAAQAAPYHLDVYVCTHQQREQLTHSLHASNGDIYIQSLSSMLAPILLQSQKEEWVLDLAAAPGGKTILMAEQMQNGGKISAVEPVKGRFFRLQANLERMGVTNTQTYLKDGRAVGSLKPDTFDRVMLDAPCSSESRFRANDPDSIEHWNLRKVAECSKKQKRLILSAFEALKSGGVMMYCTCSFSPEENELVVNSLLKKHDNATLLPIQLPFDNQSDGLTHWEKKNLDERCALSKRIWPNQHMDGFYLALIQKQ